MIFFRIVFLSAQKTVNLFLLKVFFTFQSVYLEAELVHGIDLVEIIHNKVEQRRSDSNGTVVFSGFIYLDLINLSFQDLRKERRCKNDTGGKKEGIF